MLSCTFVFDQIYTSDLSQNVTRWIKSKTQEQKFKLSKVQHKALKANDYI